MLPSVLLHHRIQPEYHLHQDFLLHGQPPLELVRNHHLSKRYHHLNHPQTIQSLHRVLLLVRLVDFDLPRQYRVYLKKNVILRNSSLHHQKLLEHSLDFVVQRLPLRYFHLRKALLHMDEQDHLLHPLVAIEFLYRLALN